MMEKMILKRCDICDQFGVGKENIFHKKDCPNNTLSSEKWEEEKAARDTKLAAFLLKDFQFMEQAEKMSYAQLSEYLVNNVWSKQRAPTLDEAVLSRVIDILNELSGINKEINNEINQ